MRARLFWATWRALWPLRLYLTRAPISRGKGLLTRLVVIPLLPPAPAMFVASVGLTDTLLLQHRETIGLSILMHGGFESQEIGVARRLATAGSWTFDVGAHVGIFTLSLARAVGPGGTVVAFEPLPANAQRLRENVVRNAILNVRIVEGAATDQVGEVELHLARDSAFPSTVEVFQRRGTGKRIAVPSVSLDQIWRDAGEPTVSFIKVDVEGGEIDVLNGAHALIAGCAPAILVEANTQAYLALLTAWFAARGYTGSQPPGFMPWNYLFLTGEQHD